MVRKTANTLRLDNVGIFQHKSGHVALLVKGKFICSVSPDPKSKRYNKTIFRELKALLVEAGKCNE